eukprot:CAMPEP_0115516650 /NCGR_PEP_ID=MMETSP0271-20121206/76883_1 /TAXON_ID=71861 /ORGANISM="Scrippsiella trochoidea, Strain CCMP3099" /LENGTH=61 /DNA_ID=CAMNT_0002947343 /DNA_START=181 /DNA_END=364 /DNA_ORIENTATION=-
MEAANRLLQLIKRKLTRHQAPDEVCYAIAAMPNKRLCRSSSVMRMYCLDAEGTTPKATHNA